MGLLVCAASAVAVGFVLLSHGVEGCAVAETKDEIAEDAAKRAAEAAELAEALDPERATEIDAARLGPEQVQQIERMVQRMIEAERAKQD